MISNIAMAYSLMHAYRTTLTTGEEVLGVVIVPRKSANPVFFSRRFGGYRPFPGGESPLYNNSEQARRILSAIAELIRVKAINAGHYHSGNEEHYLTELSRMLRGEMATVAVLPIPKTTTRSGLFEVKPQDILASAHVSGKDLFALPFELRLFDELRSDGGLDEELSEILKKDRSISLDRRAFAQVEIAEDGSLQVDDELSRYLAQSLRAVSGGIEIKYLEGYGNPFDYIAELSAMILLDQLYLLPQEKFDTKRLNSDLRTELFEQWKIYYQELDEEVVHSIFNKRKIFRKSGHRGIIYDYLYDFSTQRYFQPKTVYIQSSDRVRERRGRVHYPQSDLLENHLGLGEPNVTVFEKIPGKDDRIATNIRAMPLRDYVVAASGMVFGQELSSNSQSRSKWRHTSLEVPSGNILCVRLFSDFEAAMIQHPRY